MADLELALESDAQARRLLQTFHFDRELFQRNRTRESVSNAFPSGSVKVPPDGAVAQLPEDGTEEHRALAELGSAAISRGEVGLIILAGGMATRFGHVVKALVEVRDGHSFLDLKLADARSAAARHGASVPIYLMSSFATHEVLTEATAGQDDVEVFAQDLAFRLTPEDELFRTDDGALSPYATGHGDLVDAFRRSGALDRFRAAGGKVLLMSNVDNLLATLDPAVIGAHLKTQNEITVEVVSSLEGDRGGAPALAEGVLQIVEAFRFPDDFDPTSIPVFNTNTLALDAAAIDRRFDLDYFRVEKKLEGRVAIQFERLVGQLTAHLRSGFLHVPRDGKGSRFAPIKTRDDLAAVRDEIIAVLKARGVELD